MKKSIYNSFKIIIVYSILFLITTAVLGQVFEVPSRQFRLLKIYLEFNYNSDVINILSFATFFSCLITVVLSHWAFDISLEIWKNADVRFQQLLFYCVLPLAVIFSCFSILVYFDGITNPLLNNEFNLSSSFSLFFFVSAASEEIIFRQILFRMLIQDQKRIIWPILISSFLFAIVHIGNGLNFISLLNLFIAGVFLCMILLQTKSILFPILFHFFWNFFQGMIFGFKVSGIAISSFINFEILENNYFNGGSFGLEGSWLTTIVFTSLICIYIYVFSGTLISSTEKFSSKNE
jgi:membrane protease YdiL (CAAX protease family)